MASIYHLNSQLCAASGGDGLSADITKLILRNNFSRFLPPAACASCTSAGYIQRQFRNNLLDIIFMQMEKSSANWYTRPDKSNKTTGESRLIRAGARVPSHNNRQPYKMHLLLIRVPFGFIRLWRRLMVVMTAAAAVAAVAAMVLVSAECPGVERQTMRSQCIPSTRYDLIKQ